MKNAAPAYVATTNPCKACTPLGAALAFHGVEGCVSLLHGSQGCSTYIRRYLIGHFREPLDIASSNFTEHAAVFGGRENLAAALRNLRLQYHPEVIGLATTCLAETMGEDPNLMLRGLRAEDPDLPPVVSVSTPSYRGTSTDGFHDAVRALAEALGQVEAPGPGADLVVWAPLVSPADLRALKDQLAAFELRADLVPDWSETLDGGPWEDYLPLPPGGTPLAALRALPRARATVALGLDRPQAAVTAVETRWGVPGQRLGWPLGVRACDRWFDLLAQRSGRPVPAALKAQRARLLDALVDGHKVAAGLRVAVFGEEDLVAAVTGFLDEIGVRVAVVCTGGPRGRLVGLPEGTEVLEDADFFDLGRALDGRPVDLLVGSSKGYKLSRTLGIPLVRTGFPVHDRFGGARERLLGYDGTLAFFDRLMNAVLEKRQHENPVGYTYF